MYAEIVILAMLRQRPQYGYEIKKSMGKVFGGTVSLNNTVLYPTLKRFEEAGAVVRQVVQQEGKPNRHIYHLTERGIELLHASLCDFPPEQAANEAEFFTRVAFFEYLEPLEREAILKKRLDYLHTMQRMADEEDCAPGMGISMSNAQRVLAFHLQRVRHEYQWVVIWLEEMQANA